MIAATVSHNMNIANSQSYKLKGLIQAFICNMRKLKLYSHNIQGGVERKLSLDDVRNSIICNDVIFLQETWLVDSNQLHVDGFSIFRSDRGKHKKRNTGSGGVVTLYRNSISKGLSKIASRHRDFLWTKFDRKFFNMDSDLYMVNVYIPPENSPVHRDTNYNIMELLFEEVCTFSKLGRVGIVGDLNSRTGGGLQENLQGHQVDMSLNQIPLQSEYSDTSLPYRQNRDRISNEFGRRLLEQMEQNNLVFVNGRVLGDSRGEKTCYNSNGSSTVDYFIFSHTFLSKVDYMEVRPAVWYSDHCPLELRLNIEMPVNSRGDSTLHTTEKIEYKWEKENVAQFETIMKSEAVKESLINALSCLSIDESLGSLVTVLQEAADSSFIKRTIGSKGENSRKPHKHKDRKTPDNPELYKAKNEFNKAWRKVRLKPDKDRHIEFAKRRSRYKRLKYMYFNYQKEDRLYKLAKLEKSDPKDFWRTIKAFTKTRIQSTDITTSGWYDYFKDLFSIKGDCNKQFTDYITTSLPLLEDLSNTGPLDYIISPKELEKAIKKLKNGKSTGPDSIRNEMIKKGGDNLHRTLNTLFNRILMSGIYPAAWQKSTITPIYKSLDPNNPTNYRGVAVSDTLSKLFTYILNDRLYNYFVENELWSKNQNGFMKKKRCEDNIFIINTMYQKYVKQGRKRLYLAFIDFSKFFDRINREMLRYKLLKYGVTGNFYRVLKSYYEKSLYAIKSDSGISPYFEANNGVKQGCNLSPTLSNIYQNDIHEIFDEGCDPICLDNVKMNSLSWADDLVLMSTSQKGLQNCLDRLSTYCDKWGMKLNVRKTKFMIMSVGTVRNCGSLEYEGNPIDYVTTYKYLGLQLSSNGKFNAMIYDRCMKASRASFQMRNAISTTYNVSHQLAMSIFDKQIYPILSYGSSIWGQNTGLQSLKVTFQNHYDLSKSSLSTLFKQITGKDIIFEKISTQSSKNQVTIRVPELDDKISLLSRQQNSPVTVDIENHRTDTWAAFEKVHSSFCKFVLGVSKFSSNYAVLGELGRLPIEHKITMSHILYWHRLEKETPESLLGKAFNVCKESNHDFYASISFTLSYLGLPNILQNPITIKESYLKNRISMRMKDQYLQSFRQKLNSFEILKICKGDASYECSSFLATIKNVKLRNIFTRLRINNNKLQAYLHKEELNCEKCNVIENTEHFLLHCKREGLMKERERFLSQVKHFLPTYENKGSEAKLSLMLNINVKDGDLVNMICHHVNTMYALRFLGRS